LDRYEASLETLEAVARREPKSWKIQLGIAQAFEAIGKAGEAEREFVSAYGLCRTCNPQTGTAYGRFLVRQGRAGEAVAILEETVRRFPDTAEPRIHLGRALLDGGRVSDAIEQLERAAALDPKSAQAHLLLANAYMRAGRAADAQPHFEAAARNEGSGK
jgi:Tfp pilus assembly protein PilF